VGTADDSGGHKAALDHGEREGWGLRLPPSITEDPACAVFVVSTKASKQIANMAAAITNDILRRSALLRATPYNVSALIRFPESAWLAV
jgi:hypothetical protein